MRRRILDGALGQILAIDLTFHDACAPDKARCRDRKLAGGGCMLELGAPLLDLALAMGAAALQIAASARLIDAVYSPRS